MSLTIQEANHIMRNATRRNISPQPPQGLTKEGIFYWKLKHDFPFYSENFLKIRNKRSELVNFKLNEAQIMLEGLDNYCKENGIMRRYIILKARQMGMSTYTEGKIYHESSNNELVRSLIVAHEEKASSNLFNMSKLFYEEVPEIIRPQRKYNNGKILSFENPSPDENEKQKNPGLRSNITIATAGTGEVGRSATPTKLHISELAFFPDASLTMLGLLQGVPDTLDSLVILESTANGVGDYFYQMWQGAIKGENDFIPVFLPWFTDSTYSREFRTDGERDAFIAQIDHVSHDAKGNAVHTYEYELMKQNHLTYEQMFWRHWAIRNKCGGDEELFMQEYPSTPEEAFIASGRPKFDVQALKKYQNLVKPPITTGYLDEDSEGHVTFREDKMGYIALWERPKEGEFYCVGADVAEGLAHGDYSAAYVGNPASMDIVAAWHGHIDPDLYGVELVKLAKYYNEAFLAVESNNHGLTTLNAIKKLEYWNLYFSKNYDKIADKITQKLGWQTTNRTKPLMIDKLAEFVREKWLGIYDAALIAEMFTYIIEDNGSTNAQQGCYDDRVMASGILLQVMLEGLGVEYTPEIPCDERGEKKNDRDKDVVDPLFEDEEHSFEIAE